MKQDQGNDAPIVRKNAPSCNHEDSHQGRSINKKTRPVVDDAPSRFSGLRVFLAADGLCAARTVGSTPYIVWLSKLRLYRRFAPAADLRRPPRFEGNLLFDAVGSGASWMRPTPDARHFGGSRVHHIRDAMSCNLAPTQVYRFTGFPAFWSSGPQTVCAQRAPSVCRRWQRPEHIVYLLTDTKLLNLSPD